LVIKLS